MRRQGRHWLGRRWCTVPDLVRIGSHVPGVVERVGHELSTDVGRQAVKEEEEEHALG